MLFKWCADIIIKAYLVSGLLDIRLTHPHTQMISHPHFHTEITNRREIIMKYSESD